MIETFLVILNRPPKPIKSGSEGSANSTIFLWICVGKSISDKFHYRGYLQELKIIIHKLDTALKFAYGCRDAWWFFHRYANNEYRYILFKIRESIETI